MQFHEIPEHVRVHIPLSPEIFDTLPNQAKDVLVKMAREKASPFYRMIAMENYVEKWGMKLDSLDIRNYSVFFSQTQSLIYEFITSTFSGPFKCFPDVRIAFSKEVNGRIEYAYPYFHPHARNLISIADAEHYIAESHVYITTLIEQWTSNGSGWKFLHVSSYDLHKAEYIPFSGSSFVPLPKHLENKKAIINVKNYDHACFMWSVLASLHPVDIHPERVIHYYQYQHLYSWDSLTFPLKLDDIDMFEQNNENISINVYGYDNSICPLRISRVNGKHVDLFLFENHYCCIRNLSRLIRVDSNNKKHICRRCLVCFREEHQLSSHMEHCRNNACQYVTLPSKENNILKFRNQKNTSFKQYVVYADFEAFLTSYNDEKKTMQTEKTKKHIPSDFCFVIVERPSSLKPIIEQYSRESGEDVVNAMINKLRHYQQRFKCKLDVFFHNCKGYDSHFIIEHIKEFTNVTCIPENLTKYKCFTIDDITFKDSMMFLNTSLATLIRNIPKNKFHLFRSFYNNDLLLRKGIYPYDYMDNDARFDETCLPPRSAFHNSLTNESITEKEYDHAKQVWEIMGMKTLKNYHDLYLRLDTLLLADVFENFRTMCMNSYGLDPVKYVSLPSLSFDAALKMSSIELELLTDSEMYAMFEQGLRGGISTSIQRYAKANNKYMENYDSTKKSSYILYLDMNNQYGKAMTSKLPISNFKWNQNEWTPTKIMQLDADGEKGYVFSVDLEYPSELHNDHNEYPLAPEHLVVNSTMLSKYNRDLMDSEPTHVRKLIPNLYPKKNYIVSMTNLQYYLSMGMKLTKVSRVIEFTQSNWLKSYIDVNTESRKKATSLFEKDFYKLMNNAVFGKTMENLRKRVNVKLFNIHNVAKIIGKSNVVNWSLYSEHMGSAHLLKSKLVLNKPIYAGFAILEYSKLYMYQFHYEYIQKKYGKNASLMYTDTDSFVYHITTNDIFDDMLQDADRFDFSNYPTTHPCFSKVNEKVVGKMKDEIDGQMIHEFIALKSKMYSIKLADTSKHKAKGIPRRINIDHAQYKKSLENKEKQIAHDLVMFRQYKHQLFTINQDKTSLSPYDDKRYILENGVDTLAYGHYRC